MNISIGSLNPVKIESTKLAFTKVWPSTDWNVTGYDVPSGVAAQPMSDSECIKGATNRAQLALEKSEADFGVGIEGGLQQIDHDWFDCGWIVVIDKNGIHGIGSSARIITPPKIMTGIFAGQELGDVIDSVFSTTNAKQSVGHFGLMTNNAVTRRKGYIDGIVMALARFLHPQLF